MAMSGLAEMASGLHNDADLDPLLDRVGDVSLVLIGEASHGTHDFYAWRAAITRRLITERGFCLVAVEGDWPDCYRVNCSVRGLPGAQDPADVLDGFDRWPTWLWANQDMVWFTRWLAEYNAERPPSQRVGFYGLDVYSLWDSLRETVGYLRRYEPQHVGSALEAIRCLEPYAEDPQAYARSTRLVPTGCEDPVVRLLSELRGRQADHNPADDVAEDFAGREARFNAQQNARVAAGAEAYYRAMVRGGPDSWNVRDNHMTDTLGRLVDHHGGGGPAKAVVWEHNTHVGDARATAMEDRGLVNVGQLVRQRYGPDRVVLVGFGTNRGTVVAADGWDEPSRVLNVPPARVGSVENALHASVQAGQLDPDALLVFPTDRPSLPDWLSQTYDHRAIGVVYDPTVERFGNYVPTRLGHRYDAFCWLDRTEALVPLHRSEPVTGEQETFPQGQ